MPTCYTGPFLLIGNEGTSLHDTILSAALVIVSTRNRWDWWTIREKENIAVTPPEVPFYRRPEHNLLDRWTVRDLYGRLVPGSELKAAYYASRPFRPYRWNWSQAKQAAEERGLPIPGTGRRGGTMRDYLRGFRRHGALRAEAAAAVDSREEPVRGRIPVPPDPWDDFIRGDADAQNWKRNRARQWRD